LSISAEALSSAIAGIDVTRRAAKRPPPSRPILPYLIFCSSQRKIEACVVEVNAEIAG
jgi:hypothetical protein